MRVRRQVPFVEARVLMVVLMGALFSFSATAQDDEIFSIALGPPIRIASPPNHAVFVAPADVPILVYTRSEAQFTNVELYANGVDIGHGTRLDVPSPVTPTLMLPSVMEPDIIARLHAVWCLVWTNAPVGSYALTAVANGTYLWETPDPQVSSLLETSAPVNITIVSTTPPINATDIVNITAVDPVAIAGTNNSWTWEGMTNDTPSWTNWPPVKWQLSTNWGPKVALFLVHRFGEVTNTVTVNYNIGGTASNGVDYFALPGYANIPTGYDRALIPIVPVDHGATAAPKTVILTLTPDSNSPPDYLVGLPSHAEVLILENWPRPLPWLLPDGTFHVNSAGPDGAWFSLEYSSDLQNWTPVCTNQVFQGSIDFIDPDAPINPWRFYLAAPMTNGPGD